MVTREDVKKSAELAKIAIDADELEKYVHDLNDMMNFIDMINEKDFNIEEKFDFFGYNNVELRPDEVCDSLNIEDVFKNVQKNDANFFILKRKE